jgi:hypothetical protein
MSLRPVYGGAHARPALFGGLINVRWFGHQSAISDLAHWACRAAQSIRMAGEVLHVCGLPRARAVLHGMVGPPPTTSPRVPVATSFEEVGDATLPRPARSGLA